MSSSSFTLQTEILILRLLTAAKMFPIKPTPGLVKVSYLLASCRFITDYLSLKMAMSQERSRQEPGMKMSLKEKEKPKRLSEIGIENNGNDIVRINSQS